MKILKLHGFPRSFVLREKDNEIVISTNEGSIKFFDFELAIEKDSVDVAANSIVNLELSIPELEFNTNTLRMEPVPGTYNRLICSCQNGIVITSLDS